MSKRTYAELSALHAWETPEWAALAAHAESARGGGMAHLSELLKDEGRCAALTASVPGVHLDYSRQRVTSETMGLLHALASAAALPDKIAAMAGGVHINTTEDRAVGHIALRAPKTATFEVDGVNVVPAVHTVLDNISAFAEKVRTGAHVGATGKALTDVVSIGIGGSYLGPEFVFEALRHDAAGKAAAQGRRLRFLANVDPVDLARARRAWTRRPRLSSSAARHSPRPRQCSTRARSSAFSRPRWLARRRRLMWPHSTSWRARQMSLVRKRSASRPRTSLDFGTGWAADKSVCSAIGVLPLSLQYGTEVVRRFLDGAADMDAHFTSAPMGENLPVIMGLTSVWNSTFLGFASRALLPYSQALLRFPAHIQQVDMESNGKRVALDGTPIPFNAGEINFGEPGTNGQHSFYQLIHQGRIIPCDLIGVIESQNPVSGRGASKGGTRVQP